MRFIWKALQIAIAMSALVAAPGHAGEAESALLRTYRNWRPAFCAVASSPRPLLAA